MILFGDAGPIVDAGSAERVDGEREGGVGEDVEVDDAAEIIDVGGDVVVAVSGGGGEGFGVGDFFYGGISLAAGAEICGDDLVGAVFDPLCCGGVGGAAVGWVVLEPAVLGWVVRGGDDDAVGEVDLATAVVGEDGVREGRRGGVG